MTKLKLSDDDVRHALHWFSRQPESAPFFAALQAVVEEIGPPDTCALHAHNARRTFAADLIAMAEADKRDGTGNEIERRNEARPQQRKSRRHGPAGRG